jgi:hypothetical protein
VGFKPDLLILFGNAGVTDTSQITGLVRGLGFVTSASNQVCMAGTSKDAQATMDTKCYQRSGNTACYALIDSTTTSNIGLEGSLVTMDSDGFTINWTTVTSAGATKKVNYIAIKGGNYKCGSITSPTAGATPVSQATTGIGFQPTGILLASSNRTSSTAIQSTNAICLGAGSSSNDRRCVFASDIDAAADAVTVSINMSTKIMTNITAVATEASSTTNAEADLTSLDADGFTLNWTTRDTNAYEVILLAVGSSVAPTAPTFPLYKSFSARGFMPAVSARIF